MFQLNQGGRGKFKESSWMIGSHPRRLQGKVYEGGEGVSIDSAWDIYEQSCDERLVEK